MRERYEPLSGFLKAVVADDVPLTGNMFADANLQQVIALTTDADESNRDWAVFLLGQTLIDTPDLRAAYRRAANDVSDYVRGEAILALAMIARDEALPLVKAALEAGSVSVPVFEAAGLLAHPSFVDDLRAFTDPSDDRHLDELVEAALAACESGVPRQMY